MQNVGTPGIYATHTRLSPPSAEPRSLRTGPRSGLRAAFAVWPPSEIGFGFWRTVCGHAELRDTHRQVGAPRPFPLKGFKSF